MISDGINDIPGTFHTTLIPGIMLVLAVLSVNVFGDGLRDALDPRSKIRLREGGGRLRALLRKPKAAEASGEAGDR
jgi:hypothetical protein